MTPAPFLQLPGDDLPPGDAFWVRAEDGVRLRLVHWPAEDARRGTVLLFPGRTEYCEKYARCAARLNAEGLSVLAIDWRGQGMADRLQDDPRPGHIGEFSDYQNDVVEMLVAAEKLDLPRPWHLLGHSMGGCIGLAAVMTGLPVISATFSAPMWGINHAPMPRFVALGLADAAGALGRGGRAAVGTGGGVNYMLNQPYDDNLLTTDAEEWARLLREAVAWHDLTIGGPSYDWVGKALRECARLAELPAPEPALPMMVSLGTRERIVSGPAIRARAASWPGAKLVEIEGAEHEAMMDSPDRKDQFFAEMLAVIDAANGAG